MLGLRIRFWWNPIGVPSGQVLQSANGFRFKPCSTSPSLSTLTTLIRCANFLPSHHNNSVSSSLQFAHVSVSSVLSTATISGLKFVPKVRDYLMVQELTHPRVWRNVVQKGDTVVDATCGNGYDTLAMLKMIADDSGKGCVYGFDIQPEAIVSTSSLLDSNVNQEKQQVQLFNISHSRMDEVIPSDTAVRLVAFNLGYLPGTDKRIITMPETTVLALEAAKKFLMSGGVISLVVYIGHLGGREELEAIEAFASSQLPVNSWTCCKLQALNRPLAPVLVFMFKR